MLDNINNSYILIICLVSFIIFLLTTNIFSSKKFIIFLDKDFLKPQAFHKKPVPRIGGIASIFSIIVLILSLNFIFNIYYYEYLFFSILFFFLGFLDDIKVSLKPFIRLILMIAAMILGLIIFDIKITKTGFSFLNLWLENNFFQYFFLILCFLFVINGSNLIDGFNGLLIIHLILINSILLFIYLYYQEINFSLFLTGQIFIMFCFLLFNFPSAKIFMGDGGAYLFGAVTSLNIINTSINYPNISPIFFVVILFYLFFEVFFSFLRKLKKGTSPLQPDSKHLHMLLFKFFKNICNFKNSNPYTSLSINIFYAISLIPPLIFRENGLFCKYWFLAQLITYLFIYRRLYNFTKKLN